MLSALADLVGRIWSLLASLALFLYSITYSRRVYCITEYAVSKTKPGRMV